MIQRHSSSFPRRRESSKTNSAQAAPSSIILWLSLCCLLIFALVVLGGAVRLTGSGLSMVDWRPLGGILPPLNKIEWLQAFESYRQFPEFQLVNPDMTLAGFRFIFWMEYAHRLLGRVVGMVFLLPFLFFLWRGMLPRAVAGGLWGLFFLGALQGLLGWYMVQSGLADNPEVSHYRLLMHFMLAVIIYACLVGMAASLHRPATSPSPSSAPAHHTGKIALGMLLLMMASGALVAGSGAGYAYNTWPKMGTLWIPESLLALHPWWLNFVENPLAIQFTHRWLAVLVLLATGAFARRLMRTARPLAAAILLTAVATQFALGIATLLLGVPAALGIAHQAGAMILLTVIVFNLAILPPR